HWCGTGRGRPGRKTARRVTVKKERKPYVRTGPMVVNNFKYFSRADTVRIVDEKPFRGVRAVVWSVLLDGPLAVSEVLTRCEARGLSEKQAVAILRKMATIYHCLEFSSAE